LVYSEPEHLNEFGFQIVEGSVIEMKLALEGTIRHPASTLEHHHRLLENLLKSHRAPSLCLRGVERTVWE
jgi:hypothetical protein